MTLGPNHTPRRTVRIADQLWGEATAAALVRGESLSEVIRGSLETYVESARRHGGEPRVIHFTRQNQSHSSVVTGGDDRVTGYLKVADSDVRVGDFIVEQGTLIKIDALADIETPSTGTRNFRGHIDWDETMRERGRGL